MHKFSIWFDGGCRPTNPGNAYGSFEIACAEHLYSRKSSRIEFGFMSSNMAEYTAMNHALKTLLNDSQNGGVLVKTKSHPILPKRIILEIFSDSNLLVQQLNGRWRVKASHIAELVAESKGLLLAFAHWKLTWRPRQMNVERFGH